MLIVVGVGVAVAVYFLCCRKPLSPQSPKLDKPVNLDVSAAVPRVTGAMETDFAVDSDAIQWEDKKPKIAEKT